MANYTDGTITITEGSNAVLGVGTAFLANVKTGQFLTIAGLNRPYQISQVVDDTNLTLTRAISILGDPTSAFVLTAQVYSVIDSFTPNLSIPFIGKDDINKQPKLVRVMNTIDQNMGTVLGWQSLKDQGALD